MRAGDAAPGSPYIGRSVPRLEDERLLTGRGRFVDDVQLDGTAHALVVRSAWGHARLDGVDLGAARALPSVLDAFAFADVADFMRPIPIRLGPLPGFERFLQRPLASDRLRYVGEPVAVIVADSRRVAEDAADLIEIAATPIGAVVDFAVAVTDETVLHEAVGTNLASRYAVARGDPEGAFAAAPVRLAARFRCHRQTAAPLETRGLVAEWPEPGRLRVHGACKVTFFNRRFLAQVFGLDEAAVELIELDVGGGFGVRGELYPEDVLVPLAARRIGRPVKWIEDRREHLAATNHSREIDCDLELAATREGVILGLRGTVRGDMGAYVRTNGGVVPSKAAQFLPGPYRIADVGVTVEAAMTNKTPVGTYRGPGRFEANFFRERLLDMLARDLGLDPIEIRRRNLLTAADMPYPIGRLVPHEDETAYDGGDYARAFECLLAEFGRPSRAPLHWAEGPLLCGVGFGCFVESSGAGPFETARIAVGADGAVAVAVGCSAVGQGLETSMAQIAADGLGVDIARITVAHGSTNLLPSGSGTYHARTVVVGGNAVRMAAEAVAARARALAALRWNLPETAVAFSSGVVARTDGGADRLDLAAVAAWADSTGAGPLAETATYVQKERTYTYGAHAAEVSVDPETGEVVVRRYLMVEDIGRVLNPLGAHGQAVGAAVQGIGGTLLDRIVYDGEGQLLTGSFADYLLPTATDVPDVEAVTLEEAPSPHNPMGFKGAGEGGVVAVGAALANAVSAALSPHGVDIRELPITPDGIRALLRAKGVGLRGRRIPQGRKP